ncbi:unnamed protein product [Alopecurus aequalis]
MDLATGALGSLLPKLVQLLTDEYNRLKGLRKDVEFLERELRSMHAALRKLAGVPRDQLDDQVRLWANEVRELSYNMEDVVDRFLVRVEGPDDPVESSHKLKRLMKKMTELFTKGKTRHQIADMIKDMKGHVEEVAARRDRYRIDDIVANPTATTTVDPRLLALYKDKKDLVGIQEASVDLMNRLANGNGTDASMQHLKILSIVGFGGLGKTTLAKAVYDGMKEEFDCKAFVSVGRNPDLKKLVKNILYELDKQKYMSYNEAMLDERQLIDELRDLLQNKRYFIVIDDIWDTPTWEIVKCAFVDSNRGSRIVTTTRIFEVATTANDVYKMKALSDENSEELFRKRLFGGKYYQPAELSEKFLRKCGGVPLAIITIASLLVGKPSEEWPMVYNSIGFGHGNNKEVENTRKILLFSYYDMPCYLRTCLLYLSIYPEDYEIQKDNLIWKWVGEGFVHEEPRTGLFEVGERYFTELINRNMIQPEEWSGEIYGCCVHDLVLDMICLLSKEENFVTVFDPEEQNTTSKIHPRRLATQKRVIGHGHLDNTHTTQVRSFNVIECQISVMPPLSSFEALRVLAIDDCTFMEECRFQLENLGRLHQLRYLGLERIPIGELPKEIGDLRFLQTLYLRGSEIEALPQSVIQLRQLKCLHAGGFRRTISVPDGMGNLTSLEELLLMEVMKSPNFVKELGKLTELRRLHISIELPESWMCKTMVESLGKLQKIQQLHLDADDAKLDWEGYVPPPQLRYLTLVTEFSRLPSWINSSLLPNLVRLVIRPDEQMHAHDMMTFGEFPELLYLSINGRVDDIPVIKGGDAFPRLRRCQMRAPCRFLPGAMPSLERIQFEVNVLELKEANFDFDFASLENLPCLREVKVHIYYENITATELDEVEAAVRRAVDIHPNHPILELGRWGQVAKEEEGDDDIHTEEEEEGPGSMHPILPAPEST